MKKILSIIVVLALFRGISASAQTKTFEAEKKISEIVSLLPAQDEAGFGRLMDGLVSTGGEGVDILAGMFGSVNDTSVNYALAGWAAYVSGGNSDADRQVFASGVLRALDNAGDNELKAFYIRLLQTVGGDESVPALSAYIGTEELTDPALAALVAIGTPTAKEVIANALKGDKAGVGALASAIGQAGITGLETELIGRLAGADVTTTRIIYYALSRTGSKASLPVLAKAAKAAGYADEPTQSMLSYAALISRLAAEGNPAGAKEALGLIRKAGAKKQYNAALAGFAAYAQSGENLQTQVLKGMASPSRQYRVGMLNIAAERADSGLFRAVASKAGKYKTAEQMIDMLAFIGASGDSALTSLVLPYVGDSDARINIAAMNAAARLGGDDVVMPLLAQMNAPGSSAEVVDAAQKALMFCETDITGRVADEIAQASDKGKIAGLGILSARRATGSSDAVIRLAGPENADVAAAAYAALPGVVSPGDLQNLCTMLDTADEKNVPAIQQAVVSALRETEAREALRSIRSRMDLAGDSAYRYLVPMAGTKDPEALAVIAGNYDQGSPAVKKAALEALLAWNGPESAEYLYAIARDDRSDKALWGYIKIASGGDVAAGTKIGMLSAAMDIARQSDQKQAILRAAGKQSGLGALEFAGGFLDSTDLKVRQRAAEAVMNIALADKSLRGQTVVGLLTRASELLDGPDSSYQREAIAKHISEMAVE